MAVVLDTIKAALTEIGVLAEGETPSAASSADAFTALNNLLDAWAAERLMIYTITRTTWTIVASTASYTVGASATINIIRPTFVQGVGYTDSSVSPVSEMPLVPLTEDGYRNYRQKTQTSTLPNYFYYNPTFASGYATLYLLPIPTSSTLTGTLYAPQQIAQFSATSDTVSLPPGYARMLRKNLAVELAPSYGRQVDPELSKQARQSMEIVKRSNKRLSEMKIDPGALVQGRDRISDYSIDAG